MQSVELGVCGIEVFQLQEKGEWLKKRLKSREMEGLEIKKYITPAR